MGARGLCLNLEGARMRIKSHWLTLQPEVGLVQAGWDRDTISKSEAQMVRRKMDLEPHTQV